MMVTQTYRDVAWALLAQGFEELESGDVRQASEKGWGAAAQIVKAIAELRGWTHDNHGALYAVIDRVVHETGNDDIRRLFSVAGQLHVNFYENWMSSDHVQGGLDDVRRLLVLLQPMAE